MCRFSFFITYNNKCIDIVAWSGGGAKYSLQTHCSGSGRGMKLLQELFATPDIGDQIVAPAEMVIISVV